MLECQNVAGAALEVSLRRFSGRSCSS